MSAPLLEEGFVSFLTAIAAIQAFLGTQNPRMYPDKAPDAYNGAYIVYFLVNGKRDTTHGGDSKLWNPRFQFSCFSADKKECMQLAKTVADSFCGFINGAMGQTDRVATDVELGPDLYEEKTRLYSRAVDVIFLNSEA